MRGLVSYFVSLVRAAPQAALDLRAVFLPEAMLADRPVTIAMLSRIRKSAVWTDFVSSPRRVDPLRVESLQLPDLLQLRIYRNIPRRNIVLGTELHAPPLPITLQTGDYVIQLIWRPESRPHLPRNPAQELPGLEELFALFAMLITLEAGADEHIYIDCAYDAELAAGPISLVADLTNIYGADVVQELPGFDVREPPRRFARLIWTSPTAMLRHTIGQNPVLGEVSRSLMNFWPSVLRTTIRQATREYYLAANTSDEPRRPARYGLAWRLHITAPPAAPLLTYELDIAITLAQIESLRPATSDLPVNVEAMGAAARVMVGEGGIEARIAAANRRLDTPVHAAYLAMIRDHVDRCARATAGLWPRFDVTWRADERKELLAAAAGAN
jgi:hypothetical protein